MVSGEIVFPLNSDTELSEPPSVQEAEGVWPIWPGVCRKKQCQAKPLEQTLS